VITPTQNREAYLNEALQLLRPKFVEAQLDLPELLRVAAGWPSRGGTSEKKRVIGQCWKAEAATDNVTQIFISPWLSEPIQVLETLVHELIHAALPEAKHGADFKDAMKKIGLVGKATATVAGPDLKTFLEHLAADLGDYDNARVGLDTPSDTPKRQVGRQRKIFCPAKDKHEGETDVIYRASKKVIDLGLPLCPVCGTQLEQEADAPGEPEAEGE
jgi:SprT-like family